MSPLRHSTNVAARMGRWSARHRKTAIFGWLAFVVASFAIGTAVGMQTIDQNDSNVGEARRADHIIRDGGFSLDEQSEYVLVQSPTATVSDPGVPRGRRRCGRRRRALPPGDEAALAARTGQRGPDLGGPALRADPVHAGGLVRRRRHVHRLDHGSDRRGAEGQPRLLRRRGRVRVDGQGARRDVRLAARARRAPLDPDHARHPADRVRLARRARRSRSCSRSRPCSRPWAWWR